MHVIIKWKYFLFMMLFYTNSIKQCSVVLNGYFREDIFAANNIFLNVNSNDTNEAAPVLTSCNYHLFSSYHLTISPIYTDLSIYKYFLMQKIEKKKIFFYRILHFKFVELTEIINDLDYKLNELKSSYKNLTGRVVNKINGITSAVVSSEQKISTSIFYESVYFNIANKTITRMILKNEQNSKVPVFALASFSSSHNDFYVDFNYWKIIYLETFAKSIGLSIDTTDVCFNNSISTNNRIMIANTENEVDNKIFFNYENEHFLNLNLILNTFYNSNLLSYAIVYDKQVNSLYLNILTESYKSLKFKLSDFKRDLWLKYSGDAAPFKTKLRHSKFDIIKYETFMNVTFLSCNLINKYDCDVQQENYLLEKLKQRGSNFIRGKKCCNFLSVLIFFKEPNEEIWQLFIMFLKMNGRIDNIESTRCILKEYFGKIFSNFISYSTSFLIFMLI